MNEIIVNSRKVVSGEARMWQLKEQSQQEETERERKRKGPYKNFVQHNKESYEAEDWLMRKSPTAYRIFKFLANNMDNYNAVMCSYTVMQERLGLSIATVARGVKLLKDNKYIDIMKSGTSNLYCLNKAIVWNSYGTNYAYAKFGANIILSESEQPDDIKSKTKSVKIKGIVLEEDQNEQSNM